MGGPPGEPNAAAITPAAPSATYVYGSRMSVNHPEHNLTAALIACRHQNRTEVKQRDCRPHPILGLNRNFPAMGCGQGKHEECIGEEKQLPRSIAVNLEQLVRIGSHDSRRSSGSDRNFPAVANCPRRPLRKKQSRVEFYEKRPFRGLQRKLHQAYKHVPGFSLVPS